MSLHFSFTSLLSAGNVYGFFELQHVLLPHVDEDKLEGIMQQILIKHNDFAREGAGFSPIFTLTEQENGVSLNYHRPGHDNHSAGDCYGSLNLVQYQIPSRSYMLLQIEARSWETLPKGEDQELSIGALKGRVAFLAAYLSVMDHSMLTGVVNTFSRVTAGQRRIYTYTLVLTENHLCIRQIRAGKLVSEYKLQVTSKS